MNFVGGSNICSAAEELILWMKVKGNPLRWRYISQFTDAEEKLEQLLDDRSNWPQLEKVLLVVRNREDDWPENMLQLSQSFVHSHFHDFSSDDDELLYKSSGIFKARNNDLMLMKRHKWRLSHNYRWKFGGLL